MTEAAAMSAVDELAMLEQQVKDGTAPRGVNARMIRLRKRREKELLGPLAKLLETYEFREGMLFSGRLRRRPKRFESLLEAPQWSTIRVLDLNGHEPDPETLASLLNALPALDTLRGVYGSSLPDVACPRVTELELRSDPAPDELAVSFPNLRKLRVSSPSEPERFWSHPFILGLESVTIDSLTWTGGTLRADDCSWLDHLLGSITFGPALKRMELAEDAVLHGGEFFGLGEALAAARLKGAEIVVVPGEPAPPPRFWS